MRSRVTPESHLNVRKRYAVPPNDIYLQGRGRPEGRREFSVGCNRGWAGDPEAVGKCCHRAIDRELRSVLEVQPDDLGALTTLGFVLVADNLPGDAIPVPEKVVSVSNHSPAATGVLIRAYAHAGRRTDALRLLAELKRRRQAGYVPAAAFVNAYLGLGDNEQAFVWLERAYKEQSNILQFVKVHPYFDPIRGDPRFAELVRRVGLD